MFKKSRKKALDEGHTNNIWNRHDFIMCGLGEKNRVLATIKHIKRCIKWSKQRIVRGYADSDVWNMYGYLTKDAEALKIADELTEMLMCVETVREIDREEMSM